MVFLCAHEALIAQSALTSPTPGSIFTGSTATFSWSTATGANGYTLWLGSTGVGSNNLFHSAESPATSLTVTGLPTNGETIYARLNTYTHGTLQHLDYTYTAFSLMQAALTSPAPGSTLTGPTVTFSWSAATGASGYSLWLGSTGVGSNNLYHSAVATATSLTVSGLPANGETIYARLNSIVNGVLQHVDNTYTASNSLAALSALKCSSTSMTGAGTDSCTVTLTTAAPATGLSVSLSSSNAAVTLPATLTVPANATSAGFTATVTPVAAAQAVTLKASTGNSTQTFALQLNASVPTLAVATSNPSITYGGAVTFTATISNGPSGSVTFYNGATSIGAATINGTTASLTTASLTAGPHTITANWPGNGNYAAVTSSAITQAVNKATPSITWVAPSAITYGNALSATQLNASSTVAGTFVYTPAAGTVLKAGAQTLSVTFTPTDTTDYNTATTTVSFTVSKATPAITWASPLAITLGTALSATQLNASATIPGVFVYSPALGAILPLGSETLSVTFTPTDTTDYTSATQTVTLTVSLATPTLSINATSVGFGNVPENTMATQTVTLTSTGTASVTIISATVTGTGFTLAGPILLSTLTPGQSTNLGVQFDPATTGAATGQLTIVSTSSTNSTALIPLTGTGTATSYAVDLSWTAPSSSTDPIVGYNVYRAPSGSQMYQLLNSSIDNQTTYADSTVQDGQAYDYIIESVDDNGVESAPTSPIFVTIP